MRFKTRMRAQSAFWAFFRAALARVLNELPDRLDLVTPGRPYRKERF